MALADFASPFAASLTIERNPGATNCLVTVTGTWNHAHVTEVAFALGPYPSSTEPPAFTTTAVSGHSGSSSAQVTLSSYPNSQSFRGYASFYETKDGNEGGEVLLGSASSTPVRPTAPSQPPREPEAGRRRLGSATRPSCASGAARTLSSPTGRSPVRDHAVDGVDPATPQDLPD